MSKDEQNSVKRVYKDTEFAEEKYGELFWDSPAPLYIFDIDTLRFLHVNSACISQYGYSEAEFLQLKLTDIRRPEKIPVLLGAISSTNESYVDLGRCKHRRKNGETFFVHIYGNRIMYENQSAAFVMAVDIDERVRAEQELAEKNDEIENIIESITDGFYAVNENWEVTYINKAAERILRCCRHELLGKNLWDFFKGSRNTRFYSELTMAMEHRISVHFEEYHAPLDLWAALHVYPKKEGLSVYLVDVSKQHDYLKRIEKQNQQLKEISWMHAHEIRGPLCSIMGLIELLETEDKGANSDVIDMIGEASKKLDLLLRKINNRGK